MINLAKLQVFLVRVLAFTNTLNRVSVRVNQRLVCRLVKSRSSESSLPFPTPIQSKSNRFSTNNLVKSTHHLILERLPFQPASVSSPAVIRSHLRLQHCRAECKVTLDNATQAHIAGFQQICFSSGFIDV